MKIHLLTVSRLSEHTRILDYLLMHLPSVLPSRSAVKKAFKKELILLNGRFAKTGDWLSEGDLIEIKEDSIDQIKVFPLELEILFEDEFMAVIHKPAGFSVSGNYYKTIQNALPHNLSISNEEDALAIPRPVHRLDKLTSGVLLIAKTRRAQIALGRQFEEQQIFKTYFAIVKGKFEGEGLIDSSIEDQEAITFYKSIRVERSLSYGHVSLVQLHPKTGRTHQLRIHLAENGHPIIGDYVHDPQKVLKGKGLFLSACKLEFKHPISLMNMSFEISPPSKYDSLLERELRRWKKFN